MRLRHFLLALLLLVIGFLAGITGSDLGFADNYGVIQTNQKIIFGHYQPIRSDEWGVLTSLCLSQMRHNPPFPIVNNTIDAEGKNMLIVHDYGVPVKHISAIARPTTWGYFTGKVRFGMAWNWLFPLFVGFVGISLLFNLLLGVERINMLIALAIVYAPICSAWSNFPLYHMGLGAVSAWSFLQILKTENTKKCIVLSILSGWAASAFALTLYLPRLVPMTWLLIVFSIAIIVKDSLHKNIIKRTPYIIFSLLVICGILNPWYLDAKEAIDVILKSAYPGKRIVTGGGFTSWDFIRGWFPYQLVNHNAPISNQCELSSFPNLAFLIIFMLLFFFGKELFSESKLPIVLFGGIIVILYVYQYSGFPAWLASVTFLGKSHPPRVDSTIMLAQVMLLSYLAKYCKVNSLGRGRVLACTIATILASGVFLYFAVCYSMPEPVKLFLLHNYKKYAFIFFALYIFMVYFYLWDWRKGVFAMVLLFAIPGFLFNPVTKAPHRITSNLPAFINAYAGTNAYRTLFVTADGGLWQGNSANAVGVASLNGVHHYVDRYMFDKFYRNLPDGEQFNRFNHTMFVSDEKIERFTVDIPQGDVIRWKINPLSFNFRELPVDYVVSDKGNKQKLLNNPSLQYVEEKMSFAYFKVNK